MTISPAVVLMMATSFIRGNNREVYRDSMNNAGGLDVVEVGEILLQISVAIRLNAALIWASPARSPLAVFAIDLVHDIHSLADLAEGRKTRVVEAAVVAKINEQLRRTRVGAGGGEGDGPALVARFHWVIGNLRFAPGRRDFRITVNAELAHETGDYPKKGDVLEVARSDEVVKAVGAVRRKRAGDFNRKVSLRGLKLHFKGVR